MSDFIIRLEDTGLEDTELRERVEHLEHGLERAHTFIVRLQNQIHHLAARVERLEHPWPTQAVLTLGSAAPAEDKAP